MFYWKTLIFSVLVHISTKVVGDDCYECVREECYNPYNKTCNDAVACFTFAAIDASGFLVHEKGCYHYYFPMLVACYDARGRKERNDTNRLLNCCRGNFCNNDTFPVPSVHSTLMLSVENEEIVRKENVVLSVGLILLVLIFSACGGAFVFWFCRKKARLFMSCHNDLTNVSCVSVSERSCNNDQFESSTDSGSDLHILNQRGLAQDVTPIVCVGKGRFGNVWEGEKNGEKIAIKVFSSRDEASWAREVEVYTNIALYHENVLGFKGAFVKATCGYTELWLLTAFHENGSLYDYLSTHCITHEQMINFVRSTCSGLLHLHSEMICVRGKPAIAHRDLKTRNILVNSHGECVIADFGLAAIYNSKTSSTDIPQNYRVGTKRYMAPELLDNSIRINTFESFKQTDIYAFALILWEVCCRCLLNGTAEVYHLPYYDCVPNDPDFEDMRKVVCVEKRRPLIPDRWSFDEPLSSMGQLMKQCWHENPEARYTVCRVKKILDKIHSQIHKPQSTTKAEYLEQST